MAATYVRETKNAPILLLTRDIESAEREGFEPSVGDTYTRFRDGPIQPLWHLSRQTAIVPDKDMNLNGDFIGKRRTSTSFCLCVGVHVAAENFGVVEKNQIAVLRIIGPNGVDR